jgi:CAAX prenyl protease-like protein
MAHLSARAIAPYAGPYAVFLALVELGRWLPEAQARWMLPAKVALPALLLAGFAARGAYPELRGFRPRPAWALDVLVGLALAVLWVAPYLAFPALPRDDEPFDPDVFGRGARAAVVATRLLGFAAVTPFVEELFVRSFLLRAVDALRAGHGDFRALPVGRFAWASFAATTLWFTLSHVPWEWPVAAPVGALFTLWL